MFPLKSVLFPNMFLIESRAFSGRIHFYFKYFIKNYNNSNLGLQFHLQLNKKFSKKLSKIYTKRTNFWEDLRKFQWQLTCLRELPALGGYTTTEPPIFASSPSTLSTHHPLERTVPSCCVSLI